MISLINKNNWATNIYMSCIKDKPITCGAAENVVCKQRKTMNAIWLFTSVAPSVIQKERNIDQNNTGRRPNLWANGTAMRLPIPIICNRMSSWSNIQNKRLSSQKHFLTWIFQTQSQRYSSMKLAGQLGVFQSLPACLALQRSMTR